MSKPITTWAIFSEKKDNWTKPPPSSERAIQLKPDLPEAHNNLGNVLRDKGLLDDAIAAHRQALSIKPDYAEAHSNLANALGDSGRLDEAVESLRHAIQLRPDFAEAHFNLANAISP